MIVSELKILIVPDVHCCDFWRQPVTEVLAETKAKIIFLGDYVDGYPSDWDEGFDYRTLGIQNLEEIIELKKKYPKRIKLLLGNHDCEYMSRNCRECRKDYAHEKEISTLFYDNFELFDLAFKASINKRSFLFSHAGVLRPWYKWHSDLFGKGQPNANKFNNLLHGTDEEKNKLFKALGEYSFRRGGWNNVGSMIWADVTEQYNIKERYKFTQIFGHTQLKGGALNFGNILYDLDSRQCFYIDEGGEVRYYDTNTIVEKSV